MDVGMGNFNLPHVCIVMVTSAFQVCLGMNFILQNAKTILRLTFTPSGLIVKKPETDELSLVSLSEKSCQREGGNGLPPAESCLRIIRREAYSLLPSLGEQVLINLGDLRPTMDLYTNPNIIPSRCIAPPQFMLCLQLGRRSVTLGQPPVVTPGEDGYQGRARPSASRGDLISLGPNRGSCCMATILRPHDEGSCTYPRCTPLSSRWGDQPFTSPTLGKHCMSHRWQ